MEISITMLISAIVIGIAYSAFSIIHQSYRSFEQKNENLGEMIRLDELLHRDFSHACTINKTANGIVFQTGAESVVYEFQSGYALRTSTITDTFKLALQDIHTSFENTPVTEVSLVAEHNRIDLLDFSVLFERENIPYIYHKQYSSANLIQRNPNAIN